MKNPTSKYYSYREMTRESFNVLQKCAIKYAQNGKGKIPGVLGATAQENVDLATAYSSNKKLYPYTYIITDVNTKEDIGCLIAQQSDKDIETSIVIHTDNHVFQTLEIIGEFMEFLSKRDFNLSFFIYDDRIKKILSNLNVLKKKNED